ncbi:unnamed protein product [Didymodactylos carnosus]|uniref:NAD(P)(+)--arginine ADP-ribosyltransferase n=1 Tax=Didymodactylos carnosus TaxID=1234261 RepID=A0A8S2FPQ7_9BILA|nr:unnamed protein product [Didymodactylos carnosus]CAF4303337.1 unnamed protein product [Didymodactylos carnosus]
MAKKYMHDDDLGDCTTKRLLDLKNEPIQLLSPIEGYGNHPLVSLEEAAKPIEHLVPELEQWVYFAKHNSSQQLSSDSLTHDEQAAIHLYRRHSKSTYQTYNRSSCFTQTEHLSQEYVEGQICTWYGFSSCTESLKVLESEQSLGKTGTRTLFNIQCENGEIIQKYSHYETEAEILLLSPTQFQSEYVLHISTQTDRVSLSSGDEADRVIEESGQEEDYSSGSENFYSEADSSLDDANDNNYVKENHKTSFGLNGKKDDANREQNTPSQKKQDPTVFTVV